MVHGEEKIYYREVPDETRLFLGLLVGWRAPVERVSQRGVRSFWSVILDAV